MRKAKYNVVLKFIWGAVLLSAGIALGFYYFFYSKVASYGKDIAWMFRAVVALIFAWGLILFFSNLFVLIVYLYAKLFNKSLLENKREDPLMSNEFFWWDVFDLTKVYKKIYPADENGYKRFIKKHFQFLEKNFQFDFSFSKFISKGSNNGEMLLYRYASRLNNRQIFFIIEPSNGFFRGFIVKNSYELQNAFTNRQSWMWIEELFDYKSKKKGSFLSLELRVQDSHPFKYLIVAKECLKENKEILVTNNWPVFAGNENYFSLADQKVISDWKNEFNFLEKDYNFKVCYDTSTLLPFEAGFNSLILNYAERNDEIHISQDSYTLDSTEWSLGAYIDGSNQSFSGKGTVLANKEKIIRLIKESF